MKASYDSTTSVLLRLVSRIMVVFGALGLALDLLALTGLLLLGKLTNGIFSASRDMLSMGIFLLAAAAELIAGILGLRAVKRSERPSLALPVWGLLTQALGLAGGLCLLLRTAAPSVWKLALYMVLCAVLPTVYLFAALKLRRGLPKEMSRGAFGQAPMEPAPVGAFVPVPAQAPAEVSAGEFPAEAPAEAPAEDPAEDPAEASRKALAEALAQASAEAAAGQARDRAASSDTAAGAGF